MYESRNTYQPNHLSPFGLEATCWAKGVDIV